jgi:starvation-inducible outer membrane lipoprotein
LIIYLKTPGGIELFSNKKMEVMTAARWRGTVCQVEMRKNRWMVNILEKQADSGG